MRIVATADLHYEMTEFRPATRELARAVCQAPGEVLMVLGDTYALDPAVLHECLGLFEPFPGPKLLAAGNHDLWTRNSGRDSRSVLDEEMPRVAGEHGFHLLDQAPFVHDGVGFVGGCGWYDYSFRDDRLGVPLEFYRLKMAPGVLHRMDPSHQLDLPWGALEERHYGIGAMWNDGVFVRWEYTDESFTDRVVTRLKQDIEAIEKDVRLIIAGTHHVPFAEMVTHKTSADWAFGNAFMGSHRMGEAMLACDKVRVAIFGHSHAPGRKTIGRIDAINVGSTYREKRLVELEL